MSSGQLQGVHGGRESGFPDWHNRIDELIVSGELLGVEPTGKRVEYVGAAIFRLTEGKIADRWVIEDTQVLWKQLRKL